MDLTYFYKDLDKKTLLKSVNLSLFEKNLKKDIKNINSIATYLAMYPVDVPWYLIKEFSKENDLIMDNFSGRGTTAIASRFLNRRFVGNDLNPLAFVLSKFKVSFFKLEDALKRLNELEEKFNTSKHKFKINKNFKEMLIYYSKYTLSQLIFLRNELGTKWLNNNDVDNAILAISIGIMHGPQKKNEDSTYFSISMSNTISMSPNYVKEYSKKNNLIPPKINIFQNIKKRLIAKYSDILNNKYNSKVLYHNAIEELYFVKNNSVSLVITSPPYLSIVNYTNSNWIKLWLLGFDREELKEKIKLSDRLKFNDYVLFISKYLKNIWTKLKKDGFVCLVVGDVYEKELIEEVWKNIKDDVKYELIGISTKNISSNKKTLTSMNSKKGNATNIEKTLILKKKVL